MFSDHGGGRVFLVHGSQNVNEQIQGNTLISNYFMGS